MKDLHSNESLLTGSWLAEGGSVRDDVICKRIKWLISCRLEKIADSPKFGAWQTLYRDPNDGRYWERTFPQGGMHGGGPPQLKCLTVAEAQREYGDLETGVRKPTL